MNVKINMQVNSKEVEVAVHPMERLLDVLRQNLQLTGTKEGCGEGECGACSIFLDGKLVNSCLVPALQANGKKIETIEGMSLNAEVSKLSCVQQGFLDCGGAQCGICTPGMIMAATDLLRKNPQPHLDEIRSHLGGNLCRCTGYTKIFDSVLKAAEMQRNVNSKLSLDGDQV